MPDVKSTPLFKAFKLGLNSLEKRKPPTIEEVKDLADSTRKFVEDNREKIQKDPKYWAYHTARTGFFIGSGLTLARGAGLDLFEVDQNDPDAREKMAEGYLSYILDFFNLYEMDVNNIQMGYYRAPYDLDPRNK